MKFSNQLQAAREHVQLTSTECGRLLGVSHQTILNWEAGATEPSGSQQAGALFILAKLKASRKAVAK